MNASSVATGKTREELARRHLWMHFSPMAAYSQVDLPIIVRGEGSYVWDQHGRRFLDALSSLFCVNVGHGRAELIAPAVEQAEQLAYFSNWQFAHPPSIDLAARIAELAPGDLNRTFFTSSGSEAVESAIKLSRQYHKLTGNPGKYKVVARENAYHGTTLGAMMATDIKLMKEPFEPVAPGGCHISKTHLFARPADRPESDYAEELARRIEAEGPETVAAVIMEPVQGSGGCLVPPEGYWARVREICDEFDVLLISDEVICSWGRLGDWFGAGRLGYRPDLITTAKGLASGYAPIGALIASDRVAAPFMEGPNAFLHGLTFGGHPLACSIAMANIDLLEREGLVDRVASEESNLGDRLRRLLELPLVGDVRGLGFFQALELVHPEGGQFTPEARAGLVRFLSGFVFEHQLICRVDERAGYPVIVLSPTFVAAEEEFALIEGVLREGLEAALAELDLGAAL